MLDITGNDTAALAEIAAARAAYLDSGAPDLPAMARSIAEPEHRAWALFGVAEEIAARDPDHARLLAGQVAALARTLPEPTRHGRGGRAKLVLAAAQLNCAAGDYERAIALAREVGTGRAGWTSGLTGDEARHLLRSSQAQAAAAAGDYRQAADLARWIEDVEVQVRVLVQVLKAITVSGTARLSEVSSWHTSVEGEASHIDNPDRRVRVLAELLRCCTYRSGHRSWWSSRRTSSRPRTVPP
jgi:hypothetical protein